MVRTLKALLRPIRGEKGQGLVLAGLVLFVVIGFTALVLDVGLFMEEKRQIQNSVDAAALAAAQELPGDIAAAEDIALEWLGKNGLEAGDGVSIDFRCTSTYQIACDPATDRYDTIQVSVDRNVPLNFAPVLGLNEIDLSAKAAACTGLCGADPFRAVDVMLSIDRTGSMSNGDLDNAKDGALAILEVFDADWQRVGLTALGPRRSSSYCRAQGYPWHWGPSLPWPNEPDGLWLIAPLDDDYQNPGGSLNTSSALVSRINCLYKSAVGTDLGDPFWAAVEELQANGRTGEQWGIVFLSDGAANQPEDARNQYCDSQGSEPDSYNPCQYAYDKAEAAKALGIEVYTIGYGVGDEEAFCTCDNGDWEDRPASELLEAMATYDPDLPHYFEEPRGEDLTPIFQQIGWQLITGIRLVEAVE